MPADDGIIFSYGDHIFDPRPLFNYTKTVIKTPANTGLGEKYSVTLNGYILPDVNLDDYKGGLTKVMDDTNTLRDAFSQDFKLLLLQCDSDNPIISGYPKVINVDVAPASDNYVRRSDYTITLELANLNGKRSRSVGLDCEGTTVGDLSSKGLISLTDEFSIEFSDERIGTSDASLFAETFPSVFAIQRQMSAQGDSLACIDSEGGYVEPWQRASGYIYDNIGIQPAMTSLKGLMCVNGLSLANNFRTITVNRPDGIVSSSESWVAYSGTAPAIEELEISIERGIDNPFTNVTVNGTIVGLTPAITYDEKCDKGPEGTPKFNGAFTKWGEISGSTSYARANKTFSNHPTHGPFLKGSLNTVPLTETVGYSPIGGTISYSYTYDDRPSLVCENAISESITYTVNEPTDLFASLTILGRGKAFLQDLNTKEPKTEEISIDAILQPKKADIATIPTVCYDTVMEGPDGSFVTNDSKSWTPAQGHFTWSKAWTIGDCS